MSNSTRPVAPAARRKAELFYPPKTLREALYALVHRSPLSVPEQASELDLSPSYLYNAANPNLDADGPHYQLRHLVRHTQLNQNYIVIDQMEAALGRVAIPLPAGEASAAPVTPKCVLRLAKEFGDVARECEAALADDDRIDRAEAVRCRQELYELLQKGAELWRRLEQVEG